MSRRSAISVPGGNSPAVPAADLRPRAEARVASALRTQPSEAKPEELQRLVHELSVHQAELEMQNEELSRSQVALELSRARYFDLYDNAPVGYLTCALDGPILEANRTAKAMRCWHARAARRRRCRNCCSGRTTSRRSTPS